MPLLFLKSRNTETNNTFSTTKMSHTKTNACFVFLAFSTMTEAQKPSPSELGADLVERCQGSCQIYQKNKKCKEQCTEAWKNLYQPCPSHEASPFLPDNEPELLERCKNSCQDCEKKKKCKARCDEARDKLFQPFCDVEVFPLD